MKQFSGYKEAKASASSGAKLPEGAYVCKILKVEYKPTDNPDYSDQIEIMFDVIEGEYKDFFKKQYIGNSAEDKKWKGRTLIYVPRDDGSERDTWTKNSFAKWTDAFEKSNDGYVWDWDETKWKNKIVGIVFGTTGTVLDGKNILYTEARFAVPAEQVRSGSAPKAKFKAKNGYGNGAPAAAPATTDDGWMKIPETDEPELPF